MYRPSELSEFLQSLGIHPKKALSQNFLIDGNIIRKIITTAGVQPGDEVLEIGPGPGALTQCLLGSGARVTAVEKDNVLAKALERFKSPDRHLRIVHDDILNLALEQLTQSPKKSKVIANLPYHITTPILTALAPRNDLLESVTVMVQKEVAERMAASPGGHIYGSLTVFLNFYAKVTYAFTVSHRCFIPPPKVDSAVVHLELRPPPLPPEKIEAFFKLTRTAFEQRRKMLRASLRALYAPAEVEASLAHLGLSTQARPEQLSLEAFVAVFNELVR